MHVQNQLQQRALKNAKDERLIELIGHNIKALNNIIDYNIENNIMLFGISSDLVPFGSIVFTIQFKSVFQHGQCLLYKE